MKDERKRENIFVEAEKLFNQALALGLIQAVDKEVKLDSRIKPEFILLLANHKPAKTVLGRELEEIASAEFYTELRSICDIRIAHASYLGYGLYEAGMKEL